MGKIGNRRRGLLDDSDLIAKYLETKSAAKMHRLYGVSTSTVYRVLQKHGIPRDGLEVMKARLLRFAPAQTTAIREAYESGLSFADLVVRFGGTEYSVKSAIRRAGGVVIPVCPVKTEPEVAAILEMYGRGQSQAKISLSLNRSQSFVSRILRTSGIEAVMKTGASHGRWKGGRWVTDGGYVMVQMDRSDPLVAMCPKNGYVLEHRLVMARKIGRPLLPTETVHHIDGNRQNNHPSNVQLRQGRHGFGVHMVCMDCGSHRIAPAALATGTGG